MRDPRDLKIELLKAQLERALRYDPEWGPAVEDRPLTWLAAQEYHLAHRGDPFHDLVCAVVEGVGRSLMRDNEMLARLRRPGTTYYDGKSIVVPLHYSRTEEDSRGDGRTQSQEAQD